MTRAQGSNARPRRPLVIAYHLIFTTYGSWLPNDPRGSMSQSVRRDLIAELGELHYGRKRVQPCSAEIRAFYREADERLRHERCAFSHAERAVIGDAFEEVVRENRYTCWACAIMWDHVHLLIRKHWDQAEEMIAKCQARSRERLVDAAHRSAGHRVWGGPGWNVFLDHPAEVMRTIRYIEENPIKVGEPARGWAFVKPYDNWPLHDGHSPRSPYAKALRAAGGATA